MKVIRLMGGLGNQMFQYAFIKAKALREKEQCAVDRSFLDIKKKNANYTIRNFELDYFNIQADIKNNGTMKTIYLFDKVLQKCHLPELIHKEKSMHFDLENIESRSNYYLGYFQSEKYFKDFEIEIRNDFIPKFELSAASKFFLNSILEHKENSVSVHVRRGDYITLASASEVHGACSSDYYAKAINLVKEKIHDPHFYFFSDDIAWVKNEFSSLKNAHYAEDLPEKKSFEDMILMSKCRTNIIANSSYSWWGAWLNKNTDKKVFAPEKWFNIPPSEYADVVPESWIKI